jgi:hypothetical protein
MTRFFDQKEELNMAKYLLSLVLVLVFLGTLGGIGTNAQAQTRTKSGTVKIAEPRAHRAMPQQRGMEDILTDQSLWGEKFPAALAALPGFSGGGESQVWIFSDRVVGGNKFRERDQADRQVRNVSEALKKPRQPRSDKLRAMIGTGQSPLKPTAILFTDDRTHRVAAEGGPFLRPGLSIADVRRRLGKEERTTTEVLDDGTEHRPVILTLHFYAGGAIAFAESDRSVKIGSIDRVLLDASKISTTLF